MSEADLYKVVCEDLAASRSVVVQKELSFSDAQNIARNMQSTADQAQQLADKESQIS
jgi:hypothetical protein